jgi:hypothetical protein
MNYPVKLTLDKDLFLHSFLNPVSKLCDQCIIGINAQNIYTLVNHQANDIILYAKLNYSSQITEEIKLNIDDIKKLSNILDQINKNIIDLTINTNNIKYESKEFKFKLHVLEDGIIPKPTISIEKIENFGFDTSFLLTFDKLQAILKGSAFAKNSNKLYFFTKDNEVYTELTDSAYQNIDSVILNIGDKYDGQEIKTPIPINLDVMRNFLNLKMDVLVKINLQYKVLIFEFIQDNVMLKYIVSSLVK